MCKIYMRCRVNSVDNEEWRRGSTAEEGRRRRRRLRRAAAEAVPTKGGSSRGIAWAGGRGNNLRAQEWAGTIVVR